MLLLVVKLTSAQLPSYQHHTERVSVNTDSSSLQSFFRNGKFYGHGRYYFMATDNDRKLKDFYANAFGIGIGYKSAAIKGFQFGLSGYFIYNLYSSDFTQTDATTKVGSRYEIGQFDMLNPTNHHDMDRLEDLYLKYSHKKSTVKFGKQHIKTPFINPQDGRMRPTLVEGLLFDWNPIQKIKVEGGWLFGVSPRSTVGWYGIGQSMSIFGTGVNPNGKPSGYAGNVNSNAVYFAGVTMALFPKLRYRCGTFI
ncbi:MAG TPA: hypothetical protein DIU05_01090 [Bacteroidetes bacterium]|jgi:hypothetical protein|nr:hypothetical protein [Bacteroidota bacterium]